MWRIWVSVPLIILTLLGRGPAFAGESTDWVIRKTTGFVEYSMLGAEGLVVEEGDFLAPGMGLKTGDNGRVRLERGEEWLVVLPNTVVTNVAEPDAGMDTTLKVEQGKIGVHVQKQSSQHFSVGAPNLVAVVKGTTFSVSSNAEQSEVAVIEGLVEVQARASGEVRDVEAGEMAAVKGHSGSLSVNAKQGDPPGRIGAANSRSSIEIYTIVTDDMEAELSTGAPSNKGKKGMKGKGKGKRGNYGGN